MRSVFPKSLVLWGNDQWKNDFSQDPRKENIPKGFDVLFIKVI
jgi:hypothetical protein